MSYDESDESDEEESEKIGSASESADTFGNELGGLLRGIGLPLDVTLYDDETCDGDGGLIVP